MATKSLRRAITIIIATIIGAGVLGLPYAFAQAGYLLGTALLFAVGIAVLLEFLLVGELAVETPGKHQLVGLAKRYLGNEGKWAMQILMFLMVWGAMLAYVVGSSDVVASFISVKEIFGIPVKIIFSLAYIFGLSLPIYFGLRTTEDVELPFVLISIGLIIAMCLLAITKIDLANLQTINLSQALLPYGIVLFAISGSVIIPEVKQELQGDAKLVRKAIFLGVFIPLSLYLFFATVVVGVVGSQASEVATIAFGQLTNPIIIVLGNIFALVAMASSFIALGLVLKDTFYQDLNVGHKQAYLMTISVPLILMFFAKSFTQIIEITGAITIGLSGILIGMMALKARKYKENGFKIKNTPVPYIVIVIFTVGIILTVMELFGLGPF